LTNWRKWRPKQRTMLLADIKANGMPNLR
jgi:hypothetical protein